MHDPLYFIKVNAQQIPKTMNYRNCEIRISQTYNVLKVQAYKDSNPISCEYTCAIIDSIDFEREKGESIKEQFMLMVKEDIDKILSKKK